MKYIKKFKIYESLFKKRKTGNDKFRPNGTYVRRKKDGKIGIICRTDVGEDFRYIYTILFTKTQIMEDFDVEYDSEEFDVIENHGDLEIGDVISVKDIPLYNNLGKYNL